VISLAPTTVERIELPSSGRVVEVPKAIVEFVAWAGPTVDRSCGHKPVLDVEGEPCFAEIAIPRTLTRTPRGSTFGSMATPQCDGWWIRFTAIVASSS